MTEAVCIKCGAMKVGALTGCPDCGFDPASSREDSAKSLLLCDRFQSMEDLRSIAETIKAGGSPRFDEAAIQALMAQIPAGGVKVPLGCRVVVWILVAVMIGLAVFGAYLYLFLLR